jgi:hypothetical protein
MLLYKNDISFRRKMVNITKNYDHNRDPRAFFKRIFAPHKNWCLARVGAKLQLMPSVFFKKNSPLDNRLATCCW